MQLEVGSILEGKVTGITKFGAFVELEKGTTGLVHISEVSTEFVNDINEKLKNGDTVKVKVLSVSDDGKISLSIRRAMEQDRPRRDNRDNGGRDNRDNRENRSFSRQDSPRPPRPARPQGARPQGAGKRFGEPTTFEDMMSRFKQSSDEISRDLKRKTGDRRTSRRGSK